MKQVNSTYRKCIKTVGCFVEKNKVINTLSDKVVFFTQTKINYKHFFILKNKKINTKINIFNPFTLFQCSNYNNN